MSEVKEKPVLTGKGLLPSPPQVSAEGKALQVWVLGIGAKFRPLDSEDVFQIAGISKADVLAASEKESWAFYHDTPVHLI